MYSLFLVINGPPALDPLQAKDFLVATERGIQAAMHTVTS